MHRLLLLLIALALCGAAARAEQERPARDADDAGWELDLALYGWLTDMTGDVRLGDVHVDVDPQLWNDILRNLDGALFGALEARYRERWILQLDLFGARISDEHEAGPFALGFGPRTVQTSGRRLEGSVPLETRFGAIEIPVSREPSGLRLTIPRVETTLGPVDVDVETRLAQARLAAGYRLFDAPLRPETDTDDGSDPRRVAFDAFVGLRYWSVEAEVDVESPPIAIPGFAIEPSLVAFPRLQLPDADVPGVTFGGADIAVSESSWWIEPLVGARVLVDPTGRLRLTVAGNVGGFGIGSASDFAWEASAITFFALTERVRLAAGYRAQGLERDRGALDLDLIIHGPLLGLVIAF